MKKYIGLVLISGFFIACSSNDSNEQVRSFWDQQTAQLKEKFGVDGIGGRAPGAGPAVQMDEKDMQEFEAMMKDWEKNQPALPPTENMEIPADRLAPQTHVDPSAQVNLQPQGNQQAPVKRRPAAKRNRNKGRSSGQFMEITLEDTSSVPKGKAPLKDRKAMQRAIDKVLQDNQNTIQDIGKVLGPDAQAEALSIITSTEKALRRQAATSTSFQAYSKVQAQLLKKQEQSLNQLIGNRARALQGR